MELTGRGDRGAEQQQRAQLRSHVDWSGETFRFSFLVRELALSNWHLPPESGLIWWVFALPDYLSRRLFSLTVDRGNVDQRSTIVHRARDENPRHRGGKSIAAVLHRRYLYAREIISSRVIIYRLWFLSSATKLSARKRRVLQKKNSLGERNTGSSV